MRSVRQEVITYRSVVSHDLTSTSAQLEDNIGVRFSSQLIAGNIVVIFLAPGYVMFIKVRPLCVMRDQGVQGMREAEVGIPRHAVKATHPVHDAITAMHTRYYQTTKVLQTGVQRLLFVDA